MTIVVYGACDVIGHAVVEAFLKKDKTVIATDYRPFPQELQNYTSQPGRSGSLILLSCQRAPDAAYNFSDLLSRCEAEAGPIQTLVCVAPPVNQKPVLDISAAEMNDIINSELVAPALLMQEAARRMSTQNNGRIIIFCSMSAKTGVHPLVAPYAAAKGGLLSYMRVMASELAARGVTVNGIATSLFEPQVAMLSEDERAEVALGIPTRRFGKPSEAADAAVFLASESAGFITGETLNLSGGRFMD